MSTKHIRKYARSIKQQMTSMMVPSIMAAILITILVFLTLFYFSFKDARLITIEDIVLKQKQFLNYQVRSTAFLI